MSSVSETHQIRRPDAFGAYALFKSLPPLLLRPPVDRKTGMRPTPREFGLSIGIEDEITLDLMDLQTQKNFAARYEIAEQTLVRWNKQVEGRTTLNDLQDWARPLLANVLMRLYVQIMQGKAQPGHYKLWFQVVGGWSEKQVVPKRAVQRVNINIVDPHPNSQTDLA